MDINKKIFGELNGRKVWLYTLRNSGGNEVSITSYGGIITSLKIVSSSGTGRDIVLGFDTLAEYIDHSPYFGCIVGRYANRIGNGHFVLDGKKYQLAVNDPPNHLHGGISGFDKVVWEVQESVSDDSVSLILTYTSPDGEEGYPGTLDVRVTYTFTEGSDLIIEYSAETDKKTIVCLTNHTYFNLSNAETIADHELQLFASCYTPVDNSYISTGEIKTVAGTELDFQQRKKIGEILGSESLSRQNGGLDHNFVLDEINDTPSTLRLAAVAADKETGIELRMNTTEPGMQVYTANFLDGTCVGKNGKIYGKHAGLCLEAQHFPDSPNNPDFPSVVLLPEEKYTQTTIYSFQVLDA